MAYNTTIFSQFSHFYDFNKRNETCNLGVCLFVHKRMLTHAHSSATTHTHNCLYTTTNTTNTCTCM